MFGVKMKKIAFFLALILFFTALTSCKKAQGDETATYTVTQADVTENYNTETQTQVNTDSSVMQAKPSVAAHTQKKTSPATTQTEEKKVVTYISENPDNTYICRVSDKYGSEKSNLIAFIKTNSDTPGATVLEFSGDRDSSGNLITNEETLRYIYDVPENGDIKRASSDGKGNDGYNTLAAKTAVMLAEKFYIPSIPDMRENRRYEDFF